MPAIWDSPSRPYRGTNLMEIESAPSPSLLLCHVVRIPHIHQNLRRRGHIFQGVPNLVKKWNVALFLWESARPLSSPPKNHHHLHHGPYRQSKHLLDDSLFPRFFNRFLRADFRFQALPNPFEVWADGMDLVIFEEFQAGTKPCIS